jgi:hypothetical protein
LKAIFQKLGVNSQVELVELGQSLTSTAS